DYPLQEVVNAVSTAMNDYGKDSGRLEPEQRRTLVLAAGFYATRTQGFATLQPNMPDMHVVVLCYPLARDNFNLRPFAFKGRPDSGLVDMETLFAASEQVIKQDKRRHPEWFPDGAQIFPF